MFDSNMLGKLNKMQMYIDIIKTMIESNGITETEKNTLKDFLKRLNQCKLVNNFFRI